MTREEAAERLCLLFGWGADSDALTQAYIDWSALCPFGFARRTAHPELDDSAIQHLVLRRIETRALTLHAIESRRGDE